MNEITVDCWNTSKGETQTMYHFNPIEEFKATATIARLVRSHVISDHPGFEPNLMVGTVTLNIQHDISAAAAATNSSSSISDVEETTSNNGSSSKTIREEAVADEKIVANKIGDDLVEMKKLELDLESKHPTGLLLAAANLSDDVEDDGTTHKFININFTETVTCQSCNKKVRESSFFCCFSSAYYLI